MRRHKLTKRRSRKLFSSRSGVHPKNRMNPVPMRGGIRL